MLADRSFPSWEPIDRMEMARNQFINGVLSSTIQLKLLQEQPPALDDAVTLATQLEAVELAQRSLQTMKLTAGVSDHTSDRHTAGASGDNYQELVAQVRSLSQQLGKLRADSGETGANKRGACWKCGRPGCFRRNCPQRRPTKGKTTPERSRRGGGAYNTYVSGYRVISYFAARKGLEGSGTRKDETAAISWPSKGVVSRSSSRWTVFSSKGVTSGKATHGFNLSK